MTLNITELPDGSINGPNLNGHEEDDVFVGEPQYDTLSCINLPPKGYYRNKRLIENDPRHLTLDATTKLNWDGSYQHRDSLVMTDIEFFVNSIDDYGFKVKQWWFLQPPYFNNIGTDEDPMGVPYIFNSELTYNMLMGNTDGTDYHLSFNDGDCILSGARDIRGCWTYIKQLQEFHSELSPEEFLDISARFNSVNAMELWSNFKRRSLSKKNVSIDDLLHPLTQMTISPNENNTSQV